MSDVKCVRCGQNREQLPAPPFRNALGDRIFDSVCRTCWQEWLQHQTAVINHYGLDLRDPRAREFLTSQTESFLFGAGGVRGADPRTPGHCGGRCGPRGVSWLRFPPTGSV